MDFLAGEVLYFNKPLRWTSFDLVNKFRYKLSRKLGVKKIKVGHAGTLDPLATGVMILCTGKATKRIDEFQYQTKEYVATLKLGETTPSFDLEKEVDAVYPTEHITRELVEETLKRFIGTIEQVPPVFSACKIEGKRAYELARKGEEVPLKAKTLQQGNLHPGVGARHWRSASFRRPLDSVGTDAHWRYYLRPMSGRGRNR